MKNDSNVSLMWPQILMIVVLLVLLVSGLWLFMYGNSLSQKTVITPNQATPAVVPTG